MSRPQGNESRPMRRDIEAQILYLLLEELHIQSNSHVSCRTVYDDELPLISQLSMLIFLKLSKTKLRQRLCSRCFQEKKVSSNVSSRNLKAVKVGP